jgi:hypothetical protein
MTNRLVRARAALGRKHLDLPVIDVTHPAFRVELTAADQHALVHAFLVEDRKLAQLPALIRKPLVAVARRGSKLGAALRGARGKVLGAIETYMLQLGPDQLGPWATPTDRKLAGSLGGISVRLRLQDCAELIAAATLAAARARRTRPLVLTSLAGGTGIEAINALLVLHRDDPSVLRERAIRIDVLDADAAGPDFGARALAALAGTGGPLAGIDARLRHVAWRWDAPAPLAAELDAARADDAIVVASAAGGLFESGTDAEIRQTLGLLRAGPTTAVVGSVTRADEPIRRLQRDGGAALVLRGLPAFATVIGPTGWRVVQAIERPISDHVLMM